MDTYTLLREFADSWMLLSMVVIFVGIALYTFRPGSRRLHEDIANIPLRNDTLPGDAARTAPCAEAGEKETRHG
ncbi:MAG: cbb3-type cytochrome c oxidase subunit 3 [Alphaproteobacteria bacterium]|nr:MAG: cbb3-type cytochrome c oxidase subunit 3 [Alphaproteobacteria bacterium]